MTTPVARRSTLARLGAWITSPPDEAFADAARDGELLVARVRTWLTFFLLLAPILSLFLEPGDAQHYVGLGVTLIAVAVAVVLERFIQSHTYRQGIAFVSSTVDVSLVSMSLFAFWLVQRPIITTNSRVVWEAYLIAIAASALRYDQRVTLVTGIMAAAQHIGLSVLTWATHRGDGLLVGSEEYGAFSWAAQVSRLVIIGAMTVVALSIVGRTQRLRRMSTNDRLTGLFNRLYAEEYLVNEVLRTARTRNALVVALLDVDRFKEFNDSHGHAAGDAALRTLATVLKDRLRRSDMVARYGGEEVLIVLPGADVESALDALDQVRVAVGLTDITLPKGGTARVQVSIGMAAWGVDARTMDGLLEIADARLYEAKAAGRNRVVGPGTEGMLSLFEQA
ncbi:MAG: GGDEF domain-containing protein [Gemmatimonadetes bacterium]|nr:GGDEF domain-containing protein [Gemmatimonadota bacterium]